MLIDADQLFKESVTVVLYKLCCSSYKRRISHLNWIDLFHYSFELLGVHFHSAVPRLLCWPIWMSAERVLIVSRRKLQHEMHFVAKRVRRREFYWKTRKFSFSFSKVLLTSKRGAETKLKGSYFNPPVPKPSKSSPNDASRADEQLFW